MARFSLLFFALGVLTLPTGVAGRQLLRKMRFGGHHERQTNAKALSPNKTIATTPEAQAPSSKARAPAQIAHAASQAVALAKASKSSKNGELACAKASNSSKDGGPPACACMANNPAWNPTKRTVPKCVFIDLGANNGNTFRDFLNNKYDPIENCPSGQWEAYLVEANPRWDVPLQQLAAQYKGNVHVMSSTAAYTCVGQTSFYIDTDPTLQHSKSSMSDVESGPQQVQDTQLITVPTINVVQLIAENVSPADWVMLKMDIQGAEYDIMPCLAASASATLVDRIYMEEHYCSVFKGFKNGKAEMEEAKKKLWLKGVDIPFHESVSHGTG